MELPSTISPVLLFTTYGNNFFFLKLQLPLMSKLEAMSVIIANTQQDNMDCKLSAIFIFLLQKQGYMLTCFIGLFPPCFR